ncbi:MAG: DUF554 domain-containing protein [Chloroflexota bacterium]
MTGTLLNVATVILGGTLGTLLGDRLPEKVRETVMHGLGLVTILVGMQLALKTQNVLILLGSILLGGMAGELLRLDDGLNALGNWLERRLAGTGSGEQEAGSSTPSLEPPASTFSRGFVTASLVFCVGPMTIMGSIQDGLTGDFSTLAVKSMLDGFAALAFASSLGWGVIAAALTVLIYQGGLTLSAGLAKAVLTDAMVLEMTATGGILIVGIGLALLEIKRLRVANLLPAIFIAPLAVALTSRLF